jgi:tellurite resistance protein TehA-like permease
MTLTTLLRTVEFGVSIACSSTVLCFSFAAYRRTKLRAFALWICSSALGIILMCSWYTRSLSPQSSHADYMTFSVIYRLAFIANVIVSAVGSVMVVQHVLNRPNPPREPTAAAAGSKDKSDVAGDGSPGSA